MTAQQLAVTKPSTHSLVNAIKESEQDYEWYPTTDEILQKIKDDIEENVVVRHSHASVLDCGAGDGRALLKLTEGKRYAIEKSKPLIDAMDRSIFMVGTDFHQQTLIDKQVDIVFCNPPYSEYEQWMAKIIREANASHIYFVAPIRWAESEAIAASLKVRESNTVILDQFDFLQAERKARALVNIVRVDLARSGSYIAKTNPFHIWFNETFKLDIDKSAPSKYEVFNHSRVKTKERVDNALVNGKDVVSALEQFYQFDLDHLMQNYKAIEKIDPTLLSELNVSISGVKEGLKQKIEGLKDVYWKELFDRLVKILDRLTTKTRKDMLDTLTEHTHVDFSAINAYAVTSWALKNANYYYDDQLVAFVERMTEEANVKLYKSNEQTFGKEAWRWCRTPSGLDRYFLDYRTVISIGGIWDTEWEFEKTKYNGLQESAYNFLNDAITVAGNLGFNISESKRPSDFEWESRKQITFHFKEAGKELPLMHVRAFKNGNLHIKFNQAFMCKLNVEFGRLKGWLKSPKEAAEEINVTEKQAEFSFGSNIKLEQSNVLRLDFKKG